MREKALGEYPLLLLVITSSPTIRKGSSDMVLTHAGGCLPLQPTVFTTENAAERASANTAELPILMVKLIQATLGSLRLIRLSLWIARGSQLWVRPLPGSRHVSSGCMRVSCSVRALASPEFLPPKPQARHPSSNSTTLTIKSPF